MSWVVRYSFHVALRGYDRRQVDELLARVEGTLGRAPVVPPPVTAAEVRAARFARRMRGYASGEVDQALTAAAEELERQFP
jgi:DivIVA domain-containing protein